MDGTQSILESLEFKLSTQSKDYSLSRSDLLQKITDASLESPLTEDVVKDEELTVTRLKQLWESKHHSDINLVANDTVIPAHKFILIAASDFFRAMFSGDFAEASRKEIKLKDISTPGLEHILSAVYNGTLAVTETNILVLLDTADKLRFQEIIEACEDFLISGVHATNCFQLLQLSEKYTLPKLNGHIETFIIANFKEATLHSYYPDIRVEALTMFVNNDELDYPEIDIFKGALKWFTVNPCTEKLAVLYDVMKHIRFTYMTSSQIKEHVLSESVITQNSECAEMIENALKFVTKYEDDVYSRPIMEASNPEKPRGKLTVTIILPELDDGQNQQLRQSNLPQLFLFGFSNDGTINMRDINVFESEAVCAIFSMNIMQMGNSLFFLGAKQLDENREKAKMILLRFNVQTDEWVTLREPPFSPVVVHVSVIHNTDIYHFGGATYMNSKIIPQHTFQDGCYKYSIPTNTWTTIAKYPHPVAHPAACVLGDLIYIVGGGGPTTETGERDKVFAYNTTTNEWIQKHDLNHGRSGHRVCCINGKIYAIGGRDPNKRDIPECEVYDPEEDQWTVLASAPVPQPVASFNLLAHDGYIIILGGGNDYDVHQTTIQTLNTSTHTWSLYNWKDDQPHFIPMGSIHSLPLLRTRMSCFTRSEYTPHESVIPEPYDEDSDDNDDGNNEVNDNVGEGGPGIDDGDVDDE